MHKGQATTLALAGAALLAIGYGLGARSRPSLGPPPVSDPTPPAPTASVPRPALPPLALEGPPPLPASERWPTAQEATKLDAAGLWAWVRKATQAGDERAWDELATLVRAVRSRGVHDQVWDALWARIHNPAATGADPQLTLDEAAILARAVTHATGDRSYQVRVQEYVRTRDREGSKRQFVEGRLAEARQAWDERQDADLARARLDAARTAAKRLPAGESADLLRAIDALEVQLPPVPLRAPRGR